MRRLVAASVLSLGLLMLVASALPGAPAQAGMWALPGAHLVATDQLRPAPVPDEYNHFREEVGKRRAPRETRLFNATDATPVSAVLSRSDDFLIDDARRGAPVRDAEAPPASGAQPRLQLTLQLGQAP